MTAESFCRELAALAPSSELLQSLGLSPEEADHVRQSYCCRPTGTTAESEDHLVQLLTAWDLRSVGIGMIAFQHPPTASQAGLRVGTVEADHLVLRSAGEIVVEDLAGSARVLWEVADNSDAFLRALIPAASFLTARAMERVGWEDFAAARATAERCASLAGGERFLPFFLMLLGAEP